MEEIFKILILRIIRLTLLLILSYFICGCLGTESKHSFRRKDYVFKSLPVGVVRVDENYFCDQTEVTNLSYVEYLYWTEQVFGKKSAEYSKAFPDTSVWSDINKCMLMNDLYYLRHPAYRDYPVVGVTRAQAEGFSKWRSDRVFEFMLVSAKVISYDYHQTLLNHFSIDNYFEGKYSNYVPDTNYINVPYYRLPSFEEYLRNRKFADSIDPKSSALLHCDISPCVNDTLVTEATIYVNYPKGKVRSNYIFNLRGNVRELTTLEGVSVGGGWSDKKQTIILKDTFALEKVNAMTGFRNVCEWRRWKRNAP